MSQPENVLLDLFIRGIADKRQRISWGGVSIGRLPSPQSAATLSSWEANFCSPDMALFTSKWTLTKSQEDSPGTLATWSPVIAASTAFHTFGHLAGPVFAIRCNIIDEVFSAFPFNSCHTVHLLSGCLKSVQFVPKNLTGYGWYALWFQNKAAEQWFHTGLWLTKGQLHSQPVHEKSDFKSLYLFDVFSVQPVSLQESSWFQQVITVVLI